MKILTRWLQRNRRGAAHHEEARKDQNYPYTLPQTLQALRVPARNKNCVLTPSASQENIVTVSGTSNLFFNHFPPEIRGIIYLYAFGNRTLHIDLRSHCSNHMWGPNRTFVDFNGWHWMSNVCCRQPRCEFFYDLCWRRGGSCHRPLGERPEACFLGVLGWLMTCRQA